MYPDYNESFKYNLRYKIQKISPKCLYKRILQYKYKQIFKRYLDFDNPRRLTEKIQWLKLNSNNKKTSLYSDKLWIKNYIRKNIPELKFAKVFQYGNKFEDIKFNELPKEFVLKTNHAWKTNSFIFDKEKITEKRRKLLKKSYNNVLKINYAFWSFYELQYEKIKPQIFAEEILNHTGYYSVLPSFEVYCLNGNPEFILHRNFTNNFEQKIYNTNWEPLNFNIDYGGNTQIQKPIFLEKMLDYSIQLSKEFKFTRIDFFQVNEDLYFSEVTFTPYSGFIQFSPDIFDLYYGGKLLL